MARVNWNKENIQQLKVYGDLGQLDDFAKLIKCTPNAAKIKYGRITKIYARMDQIGAAFKSKVDNTIKVNPFKIEQVAFTGTRATPEIVIMLVYQMLNIKADKLDSILIPYGIANSKAASGSIFQQAKNYIAKINKDELVYTIKSTFSGDAKKTYLSARIWRIK
jgi:hypothetical protein